MVPINRDSIRELPDEYETGGVIGSRKLVGYRRLELRRHVRSNRQAQRQRSYALGDVDVGAAGCMGTNDSLQGFREPSSPEERTKLLDQAIAGFVGEGGRLVDRHDWTAVVLVGKPVNHVLHLILTILSVCAGCIWAPVWLLISAIGGERRQYLTVDEYGKISQRREPLETYRKVMIGIAAAMFVLWFVGTIVVASTLCVGPVCDLNGR
jgi:hypothetical protein